MFIVLFFLSRVPLQARNAQVNFGKPLLSSGEKRTHTHTHTHPAGREGGREKSVWGERERERERERLAQNLLSRKHSKFTQLSNVLHNEISAHR